MTNKPKMPITFFTPHPFSRIEWGIAFAIATSESGLFRESIACIVNKVVADMKNGYRIDPSTIEWIIDSFVLSSPSIIIGEGGKLSFSKEDSAQLSAEVEALLEREKQAASYLAEGATKENFADVMPSMFGVF